MSRIFRGPPLMFGMSGQLLWRNGIKPYHGTLTYALSGTIIWGPERMVSGVWAKCDVSN
jgi:hypothetical protein